MGGAFRRAAMAAFAMAGLAAHAIATEWTVVDLTPGSMGMALAVSENGVVVGCRVGNAGQTTAFVYSNGQSRDLAAPAGSTSCALAVNGSGMIAGRINGEITIWDAGGGARGLGVQGNVTGINDAGAVVGAITDGPYNGGGATRAFMWANGVMTDLGVAGTAIGINERGQVAVISGGKLYMYENGVLRDLGAATVTNAYGFNDRGEIVGMSSFGHGPEPFIYDGAVHQIPGAYTFAGAVAINNVGQVLGSGEGVYGFLVEGGQAVTLSKLAAGSPGFWNHMEGKAINDRGWIVGQNGSSDFNAFLMMPKAASTPSAAGNPAQRAATRTTPLIHSVRTP